jgi:hypothetical protein
VGPAPAPLLQALAPLSKLSLLCSAKLLLQARSRLTPLKLWRWSAME